ncbi:unnamed protein product [Diamesa serratosioi]
MSESNFGIDLLLESQKDRIKSTADILMIVVHWMLVKNDFRCVGVGDSKIYNEDDKLSELLPEGWNQNPIYTLRYSLRKQIYILFGIVSDDLLLVNLLDAKTFKTTNLAFEVNKIVKSKTGSTFEDFIDSANNKIVIARMNKEIVTPILETSDATKSESTNPEPSRPVSNPSHQLPPLRRNNNNEDYRHIDPLRVIGRGDLNPFGGGGGMIFRPELPFGPGGFMPMGAPNQGRPFPGARFDPPNPLGRLNPDNDELQPPPGYDDMFM